MSTHRVPRPSRIRALRAVLGVSALGAALAVTGTVTAQAAQSGPHAAARPDTHGAGHTGAVATPKPVPSVPGGKATPRPVPSVPGGSATPKPVPSVPNASATPKPVPSVPGGSATPKPVPSVPNASATPEPAMPHHGTAVPARH